MLTMEQRIELGEIVASTYTSQQEIKKALQRVKSEEPEGVFNVLSYPRLFSPTIDKLIAEYYRKAAPKKRKIPVPVYKAKPKFKS